MHTTPLPIPKLFIIVKLWEQTFLRPWEIFVQVSEGNPYYAISSDRFKILIVRSGPVHEISGLLYRRTRVWESNFQIVPFHVIQNNYACLCELHLCLLCRLLVVGPVLQIQSCDSSGETVKVWETKHCLSIYNSIVTRFYMKISLMTRCPNYSTPVAITNYLIFKLKDLYKYCFLMQKFFLLG